VHKSRPGRTTKAPYGRACPPVASLPSPRRLRRRPAPSAGHPCGVPPLRGSPSGNRAGLRPDCLPGAATAAPVPAPPPAPSSSAAAARRSRKAGLAGKAVCQGRAQPRPPALAERPQVERQEGRAATPTRPTSWPASPLPTMTAAKRGSPIVRNDDAGPGQGTAPKLSRSAQDARNRARAGERAGQPRKTPLRASYAVFRRRRASPAGRWPWPARVAFL